MRLSWRLTSSACSPGYPGRRAAAKCVPQENRVTPLSWSRQNGYERPESGGVTRYELGVLSGKIWIHGTFCFPSPHQRVAPEKVAANDGAGEQALGERADFRQRRVDVMSCVVRPGLANVRGLAELMRVPRAKEQVPRVGPRAPEPVYDAPWLVEIEDEQPPSRPQRRGQLPQRIVER